MAGRTDPDKAHPTTSQHVSDPILPSEVEVEAPIPPQEGVQQTVIYERKRRKLVLSRGKRPANSTSSEHQSGEELNEENVAEVEQPKKKRRKVAENEGPRNRSSPARLCKLNNGLVDDQKIVIRDIEFGGLLDIKATNMPGELSQWIMKHYDPEMSQIIIPDRGKIPVDAESVRRIWGLPNKGRKVCFEMNPDVIREFNSIYNITGKNAPTLTSWCTMIKKMGGAYDDKFLRAWLAVAFSCFLAPTTSLSISPRCYTAILDTDDIKNTKICDFVIDQLRLAFMGFGEKKKAVCCCVFHLVILYLDSLDVDEPKPPTLPRASIWNDDLIAKVMKKDKKGPGEFGKLRLKTEFSRCANDSLFGSMDHVTKFVAARLPENYDKNKQKMLTGMVHEMCTEMSHAIGKLVLGIGRLDGGEAGTSAAHCTTGSIPKKSSRKTKAIAPKAIEDSSTKDEQSFKSDDDSDEEEPTEDSESDAENEDSGDDSEGDDMDDDDEDPQTGSANTKTAEQVNKVDGQEAREEKQVEDDHGDDERRDADGCHHDSEVRQVEEEHGKSETEKKGDQDQGDDGEDEDEDDEQTTEKPEGGQNDNDEDDDDRGGGGNIGAGICGGNSHDDEPEASSGSANEGDCSTKFFIQKISSKEQGPDEPESISLVDMVKMEFKKEWRPIEGHKLNVPEVFSARTPAAYADMIFQRLLDENEMRDPPALNAEELCPPKLQEELMQRVCGLNEPAAGRKSGTSSQVPIQQQKKQKKVSFNLGPTQPAALGTTHGNRQFVSVLKSKGKNQNLQQQVQLRSEASQVKNEASLLKGEASQVKNEASQLKSEADQVNVGATNLGNQAGPHLREHPGEGLKLEGGSCHLPLVEPSMRASPLPPSELKSEASQVKNEASQLKSEADQVNVGVTNLGNQAGPHLTDHPGEGLKVTSLTSQGTTSVPDRREVDGKNKVTGLPANCVTIPVGRNRKQASSAGFLPTQSEIKLAANDAANMRIPFIECKEANLNSQATNEVSQASSHGKLAQTDSKLPAASHFFSKQPLSDARQASYSGNIHKSNAKLAPRVPLPRQQTTNMKPVNNTVANLMKTNLKLPQGSQQVTANQSIDGKQATSEPELRTNGSKLPVRSPQFSRSHTEDKGKENYPPDTCREHFSDALSIDEILARCAPPSNFGTNIPTAYIVEEPDDEFEKPNIEALWDDYCPAPSFGLIFEELGPNVVEDNNVSNQTIGTTGVNQSFGRQDDVIELINIEDDHWDAIEEACAAAESRAKEPAGGQHLGSFPPNTYNTPIKDITQTTLGSGGKYSSSSSSGEQVTNQFERRVIKPPACLRSPFTDPENKKEFHCKPEVNRLYASMILHARLSAEESPAVDISPKIIDYSGYHVSLRELAESMKVEGVVLTHVFEVGIQSIMLNLPADSKKIVMPLRFSIRLQQMEWNTQEMNNRFNKSNHLDRKDMIMFPILENLDPKKLKSGNHYWVFNLNLRDRKFEVLDSLRTLDDDVDLDKNARKIAATVRSMWEFHYPKSRVVLDDFNLVNIDVPRQNNDVDCGIYGLTNTSKWVARAVPNYGKDDIPSIRKQLTNTWVSSVHNKAPWKEILKLP